MYQSFTSVTKAEEKTSTYRGNSILKKADIFAEYYLTGLRPEPNNFDKKYGDEEIRYDQTTFNEQIESLEKNADASYIDLARLNLLYRTMYGMTTENNAKVLMNAQMFLYFY